MASAEFRDCDPESIDRSRNAEPPDLSHEAALSFRKPDFRRTDELRTSPLFCHAQDAPLSDTGRDESGGYFQIADRSSRCPPGRTIDLSRQNRSIRFWRWLLAATCLVAVVSPAATGRAGPPEVGTAGARPAHLLVVLIGGMDSDPSAAQIAGTARRNEGNSGLYRMLRDLRHDRVLPEYFNWNGTRAGELKTPMPPRSNAIAACVAAHLARHPQDRVALVGNSWGGQTALEAIQLLRRRESPLAVHLAVFLDAASAGRGQPAPRELPENVSRFVQYRTRNVFVWGKLPADTRLESIDLGDPAAGFMHEGQPPYNAPLDFKSHVAAEWDEQIHRDIERRLLELLPED